MSWVLQKQNKKVRMPIGQSLFVPSVNKKQNTATKTSSDVSSFSSNQLKNKMYNTFQQVSRHGRAMQDLKQKKQQGQTKKIQKQKDTSILIFTRVSKQNSLKKKPTLKFHYQSPAVGTNASLPTKKENILVVQPEENRLTEKCAAFKRQIVGPSNIGHSKMKRFQENPQKYLSNVQLQLDNVFKKSIDSLIRTAKVIPVKHMDIRDSTDLLQGFNEQ